jgi:hypothetical protein
VVTLVERTFIVLIAATLLLSMLYVAGNFQRFASGTQVQLLIALQAVAAIATVMAPLAGILEVIVMVRTRTFRGLWRLVGLVAGGAVSLSFVLGSSTILVLMNAA